MNAAFEPYKKIQQGNRGASESKCPFSDIFKTESCLFLESRQLLYTIVFHIFAVIDKNKRFVLYY